MKATVKNGVFTLVSELTKKDLTSGYAKAVATDEDGKEVYCASYNADAGRISNFEIVFNTIVDGKLALTIITGEKKASDIKKSFGANVVLAQKYLPIIANNIRAAVTAVDNAFDAEDAEPETDAE